MKVRCANGSAEISTGTKFQMEGANWEVVETGVPTYGPSSLGGTPCFWCKPTDKPEAWKEYQRADGCVEICGDSIAATLLDSQGVE